jgi:hypothetical protein
MWEMGGPPAHVGEKSIAYKILVENVQGESYLEKLRRRGRIILKVKSCA